MENRQQSGVWSKIKWSIPQVKTVLVVSWFRLREERGRCCHFILEIKFSQFFFSKFTVFSIALYHLASLHPCLSPLQFVDLFLLVVLFIFSLPQDLQKSFHLGLGLPSILFVLGHFLLQAGYAFGEFSAGLGIYRCTLSLEQKWVIINKQSVSF